MARDAGLDLVEVAPTARPPVCRIMDYGKWRYQQQKKDDKSKSASKAGQLKELKLRTVKIGDHDLMIKINHARGFLEEGNKVQFTLQFRGRENAHPELGRTIFQKIKESLCPVSKVEPGRDSKLEGRRMTMVLQPEKKTDKQLAAGPPKAVIPRPVITGPVGPATRAGSTLNRPVAPAPATSAPAAAPASATSTVAAPPQPVTAPA